MIVARLRLTDPAAILEEDGCDSGWKFVLQGAAVAFVGNLVAPRIAYLMRWPTRSGPKGVGLYIVLRIAFHFGLVFSLRQYLVPWVERIQASKRELEGELGREPTDEEEVRRLRQKRG